MIYERMCEPRRSPRHPCSQQGAERQACTTCAWPSWARPHTSPKTLNLYIVSWTVEPRGCCRSRCHLPTRDWKNSWTRTSCTLRHPLLDAWLPPRVLQCRTPRNLAVGALLSWAFHCSWPVSFCLFFILLEFFVAQIVGLWMIRLSAPVYFNLEWSHKVQSSRMNVIRFQLVFLFVSW